MNSISFITANFVGRELGYQVTEGWYQGNNATNDYFRPIDTFRKRFNALLREIKDLGFQAIDLWMAHLHWAWATNNHTKIANSLIAKHRMKISSMAGNWGENQLEFEAACRLANAMEVRLLTGSAPFLASHRKTAVEILRRYNLEIALVNRREKDTDSMLRRIGYDNHDIIGVAFDTAGFHRMGVDLMEAFEALAPNLKLVRLKNIKSTRAASTCLYSKGCIPMENCVSKLKEIKFNGNLTIEHYRFDKNPAEECRQNFELVKNWLSLPS